MTPAELEAYAAHYLDRLGSDENAYFALIEAPRTILPLLAAAFRTETDPVKRSTILEVIWQHRDPSMIPLLGEALHDLSPKVWKQALDGLVTIGGPQSIATIEVACSSLSGQDADAQQRRGFQEEALAQLRGSAISGN
jgi:hypothetical protein